MGAAEQVPASATIVLKTQVQAAIFIEVTAMASSL